MLSKVLIFSALILLPAMANAQTADNDMQLELRYYAPKLKFTSQGIVPKPYSNFRDTLNIKNGNAPEYRLSGKNLSVDYIRIHEKGAAKIDAGQPADAYTKLNLDYASANYLAPIKSTENSSSYWLAGLRYYRFDTSLNIVAPYGDKTLAKQLNQIAPAVGIGGKRYLDAAQKLAIYSEFSGFPLGGRGHFYDFDAGLKYSPCKNLTTNVGYRVLDLKINNDDGSGLYKLSGWYGGLNYSF